MSAAFIVISILTIAGALGAVAFRNPIHCALSLAACFAGLAAHYVRLNAEFAGFAQLLVYVGAVAILIVFAILLTRGGGVAGSAAWSRLWLPGAAVALGMLGFFGAVIWTDKSRGVNSAIVADTSVRKLGELLMTRFVLPLEIMAVLLTAAMIAAVILAMPDKEKKGLDQ
jgi:NADH-quinone oxidoreductase subunit J